MGNAGLTATDLAQLAVGQVSFTARVDAGDGGVLVELLGLDRVVASTSNRGVSASLPMARSMAPASTAHRRRP